MNIDLKQFDETWNAATPGDTQAPRKEIPDANYIVRVERAEWIQSESDSVPYLSAVSYTHLTLPTILRV